jgi:hypothetical protein
MTTPTHSHKAWTDKGGHVTLAERITEFLLIFRSAVSVAYLLIQYIRITLRARGGCCQIELISRSMMVC